MRRFLAGALLSAFLFQLSGMTAQATPLPAGTFAYDAAAPLGIKILHQTHAGTLTIDEITFASPKGDRIHGQLILPRNKQHRGGVLFVHWLGDQKTTNLTEFHRDALTVAQRGSVALLIDAMWSAKEWYAKVRMPETDFAASINQVIDLRRSLDVLLSQPGVDSHRIAYVGHDFGAMYGALLAGVDQRVRWYVLMAGNSSMAEWYLYGAQPKDKTLFLSQMEQLSPPEYLAKSKAEEFLFQYANKDGYIPMANAMAFVNAAPLPHGMFVYDAKHSLDVPEAFSDRITWLEARLNPAP